MMRLLEFDSDGDLRVSNASTDKIPVYAILSHTWRADEDEVTFNDVQNGLSKSKVGYTKIEFCGQQARKDGLRYFWVDTCTIDKANHTELSEAITSMFRWYRDAVKCYVYLSDVSIYDQDNASPKERPWESAFRRSRWFKRGWTLQELLAPKSVEFFSREGEYLGDRNLLEQVIHEITNIPIAALRGTLMSHFSTDEKMRWVAGRHTKRIEDRAYCLLGIFGVHMYLNYGEEDYAFVRLEREIQGLPRVSKQYDIPFSLRGVPVIERFADRPTELAKMGEGLLPRQGSSQRKIFVLSGLGGMGKTQLAARFARDNHSKYSAVFWLDGSSSDSLKHSIAFAATRIPAGQIPEAMRAATNSETVDLEAVVEHFLDWLSLPDNDCWLLVIDNVDREYRAQNIQPGAYDITRYFPSADHGSIIITTRLSELEQHGTAGKKLKKVDDDLARAIFCKWCTRSFDEEKGTQLLQLLGGLPLALTQAAAYIQQTGTSFTQYIDLYNNHWKDLMQSQEKGGTPLPQYNRGIWTTWMISFDAIRRANEAAANLLLFWAFLDNRDLWFGLFEGMKKWPRAQSLALPLREAYKDKVAFNSAIRLLLNYGLVEEMENLSGYMIHPVVHQWSRHVQSEEQQVHFTQLAVVMVGLAVPSNSQGEFWITQRRLLGHADRCFHWVVDNYIEISKREIHTGKDESKYIDDVKDILEAFNQLGNLYADQGKLEQAEAIYERALRGCEKALGAEHMLTLSMVNNIGYLYIDQGKLEQAEAMFGRALRGYEKALGAEHTSTLLTVNNLGYLYNKQGKLEQAEAMFGRALRGLEKALGAEHTLTLLTVSNLGFLYINQGKLEQAKAMLERAQRGYEKALQSDNLNSLHNIYALGFLYRRQGKTEEAREMLQRAVLGLRKILGENHPNTLEVANLLTTLPSAVEEREEEREEESCSIIGSHNTTRKRDRLEGLGRLKRSRASRSRMWLREDFH